MHSILRLEERNICWDRVLRRMLYAQYTHHQGLVFIAILILNQTLTRIYIIDCGATVSGGSALTAAGDCNMPCSGNATQACGGPDRLTLFHNTVRQPPAGPVVNPGPAGWASLGCYS